jgi:hypothetical protein
VKGPPAAGGGLPPNPIIPAGKKQDSLTALKAEVLIQCWRADCAWNLLWPLAGTIGLSYDPTDSRGKEQALLLERTEIVTHIHTILSAAGIVSRILWPTPPSKKPPTTDRDRRVRDRAIRAAQRARRIWKEWHLPAESALRPLRSQDARNAAEHVENEAAEWFEGRSERPLLEFGMGKSKVGRGELGPRISFRYLFLDTPYLRVKVGTATCSLGELVACMRMILATLPITGVVTVAARFDPRDPTQPYGHEMVCCPLGLPPHRV